MIATVVEKVAPTPEPVPVDADEISELPEIIGFAQVHVGVNRDFLFRKQVGIAVVRKIDAVCRLLEHRQTIRPASGESWGVLIPAVMSSSFIRPARPRSYEKRCRLLLHA
jgi:hypothetical protein